MQAAFCTVLTVVMCLNLKKKCNLKVKYLNLKRLQQWKEADEVEEAEQNMRGIFKLAFFDSINKTLCIG